MALHIACSARYLRTASRTFDKVTSEYWPTKYWLRLKVTADGQMHRNCLGRLTGLFTRDGRSVSGFDPLIMLWVSEPRSTKSDTDTLAQAHYRVDIPAGGSELAGLVHIKLRSEGELDEAKQQEWNEFPEVQLNRSRNESNFRSKKVIIPYGEYFVSANVSDANGPSVKRTFFFAAFPEQAQCHIRPARFYERWRIVYRSVVPW